MFVHRGEHDQAAALAGFAPPHATVEDYERRQRCRSEAPFTGADRFPCERTLLRICSGIRTRVRLNDMAGLRILDIRSALEAFDQFEGELRDVNGKNELTAVADTAGRLRVSTYA